MTDVFSKKKRSDVMRSIKSKGNRSTELKLIELFKARRIVGWRRNSTLSGRPDFIFPKQRVALFADGCFWHGHSCRNLTPAQNADYWREKIKRNRARDRAVTRALKKKGWRVVRLWECEIKKGKIGKLEKCLVIG
ncbi:MAG: very short patch repair endonuclease [Anaerolineales bacterium]|nr:very short patch repair endonuclease [Anaerolineales bacterium]